VATTAADVEQRLAALGGQFRERFARAASEQELRVVRADVLGKKGALTGILKLMGSVPADQRRQLGERANGVKGEVEAAYNERLAELRRAERQADLNAAPFDLTLPGRVPAPRGHLHPIRQMRDHILEIFQSLGFEIAWGPEVELEVNNFTKLAFPPDHPATDMQDTFWVKIEGAPDDVRALLRTHTSNVQVREMSTHQPPMAVVSGGAVYRRDDDITHSPMFHQVEGFLVDTGITLAHLKGVLTEFAQRLYGRGSRVRFRPSYFPFVEPGAEMDIGCVFCAGDEAKRPSCRVCKGTGWVEVLGCGMVHPLVFQHCDIDAEKYTGFAFGVGVERLAMLRYQVPDIRIFFENDPRFLAQF
jgi:phenylalanyl-tRNA synthetase alpha chain